jgi:spore maturation protein CgeB
VFEACGAGACLITDAWEGIEMFLAPGDEVLLARSGEEIAAIMARLTPGEARRIAGNARRRILAEHTYRHRAAQVTELLEGMTSKREAAE